MIRRVLWRLLLEEGGWSRIWYGLATAMVIAGGGLIYHQATTGGNPPAPPSEGWLLTSSNIGLAPFGLTCGGLSTYTTNPVPAGTHIFQKRIVWSSGSLDLDAGGITIEQSCIQPTATDNLVTVHSYPSVANPNVVIDSEFDGSLVGTQTIAYACALRGIFSNISRNYIHDVGSGICHVDYNDSDPDLQYNMLVQNNLVIANRYYGDPGGSGSHNEAGTERCSPIDQNTSRTTRWLGNWLQTDGNSSGGIFTQTPPGYGCPVGNMYLDNNYFDGNGGWDLAGDGSEYSGDLEVTNSRFIGTADGGFGTCALEYTLTVSSGNYVYNPSNPPTYQGSAVSC